MSRQPPDTPHWYHRPPDLCVECGRPRNDPAHKRRCHLNAYMLNYGGTCACVLEEGHDGDHVATSGPGWWLIPTSGRSRTRSISAAQAKALLSGRPTPDIDTQEATQP